MGLNICMGVGRIDEVKEEVEEECTGDNIEVDHDSTGLIHSFVSKDLLLKMSNLNLWKVHRCVGELVSRDGEVDGDHHQAVQAREGLGQGKERTS